MVPATRRKIQAEASLDGLYVVRTNLDARAIDAHQAVGRLQEPLPGSSALPFVP